MLKVKATIKTPEMTITVAHNSRMSYGVFVEGLGEIGGRGNLSQAVALANQTAALGLQELKTRIAHAPYGMI